MQDNKPHIDRRVVRTKRAVKDALARLLAEKELGEITVSDIAAEADINRKTFYNYYSGVHEVIGEIEDDIVAEIDTAVTGIGFIKSLHSPIIVFEKLTAVINTDVEFFGFLLSMNTNVSLTSKLADLLKSKFKMFTMQFTDLDELRLNLMTEFVISGMVAVYRRWFHSDRSEPIERISEQMKLLAFQGFNGYLDIKI